MGGVSYAEEITEEQGMILKCSCILGFGSVVIVIIFISHLPSVVVEVIK